MRIIPRFRNVTLIGFIWTLLFSGALSRAEDGDARLKKRIAELEAENHALRKIIAEIQSTLKSVPETTIQLSTKLNGLRIVILPGDWGGAGLVDMRKVCESAARPILAHLPDDGFPPFLIQRSNSGPITLFRRGKGNEHIVRLDTGGRAWAQLAFQFSHEFCHVVCNYREAKNQQLWFEESLCECASLYSMRQMADEWKTNPPYANWKSYSTSLTSYVNDRVKKYQGRKETLVDFYRTRLSELEKTGTNRDLNGYIAVKLLPLFEETPAGWQSLRYINLGPIEENTSFKAYLKGWYGRVPERHKAFVRRIAEEFKIEF